MTKLPRESRCSDRESGDRPFGWEWVPLSCGRGIGERGLSRAESCGGFRLVWAPNPAAGRLASEAAAFPQLCCCLSRGVVQCRCSLFPWRRRRDERDQRSTTKTQGETSRDELSFPHRGGERLWTQTRDLPSVLGSAHDSGVRMYVLLAGWETFQSSRVSNQERLGNQRKGTSERVSVTVAREWLP